MSCNEPQSPFCFDFRLVTKPHFESACATKFKPQWICENICFTCVKRYFLKVWAVPFSNFLLPWVECPFQIASETHFESMLPSNGLKFDPKIGHLSMLISNRFFDSIIVLSYQSCRLTWETSEGRGELGSVRHLRGT